jgi:hypothetical protein
MALVICHGIPSAFDDAEMNSAIVTVTTAFILGADAADGGSFTHGGTPLSVGVRQAENKNAAGL